MHHEQITAYHRQAKGLVERFHRQLKAELMAHGDIEHLVGVLPVVFLGIPSAFSEDRQCATGQLVYGTSLRRPAEFICRKFFNENKSDSPSGLKRSKDVFKATRLVTPWHTSTRIKLKELKTARHVFLHTGTVGWPLWPAYTGPHLVIERHAEWVRETKQCQSTGSSGLLCKPPRTVPSLLFPLFTIHLPQSPLKQRESGHTALINTPSLRRRGLVTCWPADPVTTTKSAGVRVERALENL